MLILSCSTKYVALVKCEKNCNPLITNCYWIKNDVLFSPSLLLKIKNTYFIFFTKLNLFYFLLYFAQDVFVMSPSAWERTGSRAIILILRFFFQKNPKIKIIAPKGLFLNHKTILCKYRFIVENDLDKKKYICFLQKILLSIFFVRNLR